MGRNQKALRNTAFHEAGHAVEAFMLGVPFRSVTIKAAAESLGMVRFHRWPKWVIPNTAEFNERRARAWLEKQAQISFAGQIAETIHTGRRPARRYFHARDNDHAFDNATVVCGSDDECSAWLDWLFIRTRDQLSQQLVWNAVEALAEELMKWERVSGARARKLIRNALSTPSHEERSRLAGIS